MGNSQIELFIKKLFSNRFSSRKSNPQPQRGEANVLTTVLPSISTHPNRIYSRGPSGLRGLKTALHNITNSWENHTGIHHNSLLTANELLHIQLYFNKFHAIRENMPKHTMLVVAETCYVTIHKTSRKPFNSRYPNSSQYSMHTHYTLTIIRQKKNAILHDNNCNSKISIVHIKHSFIMYI